MLNKIINKKYFHRSMITLCTLIAILVWNMFAPPYEHQVDSRKREYYPSTVVDKRTDESCGKYRCTRYNTFTVQLTNGEYKELSVTNNVYDSYSVEDTVHFERSSVDPVVLDARDRQTLTLFTWFLFVMCLVFRGLFVGISV